MTQRESRTLRPPSPYTVAVVLVLLAGLVMGASVWTTGVNAPARASAQQVFDGPNGVVEAVAVGDDGTVYLGGNFTAWGPQTGGGAVMHPVTAAVDRTFPPVVGSVNAVVSDGAGGWYIGGSFSKVGSEPRARLAHILATGEVSDTWVPQVNSNVTRMVRVGDVVYVGGEFTQVCGVGSTCGAPITRNYLVAINADGSLNPWNPNSNGAILGMTASSDTIYVGGDFTSMCGAGSSCGNAVSRSDLAAIKLDGTLDSWGPVPSGGRSGTWVRALAVQGTTVYVGGNFTSMGGVTHRGLAAVDADGMVDNSWSPSVTGGYPDVQEVVPSPDGTTLYLGGDFTTINASTRNYLGAVNVSDGSTTSWNPNPDAKIWGIAASDSTIYATGEFSTVCGAGSSCDQTAQPRMRFAAFGSDGTLKSWNPNTNGGGYLNTISIAGSTMYVGGNFSVVGAASRQRLAAVDASGELTSWNPGANNQVNALVVSESTVYAGGYFTQVAGTTRNRLAAINTDGTLATWNPNANDGVNALAISGSTIYAGGDFTQIGISTRNHAAAIGTDGTLASWNPDVSTWDQFSTATVLAMQVSGSTVYIGGVFTDIGFTSRDNLAAIGTNGIVTPWDPGPNSTVHTLGLSGSTIYAGGDFSYMGGSGRNYLAAVLADGTLTSWDPAPQGAVYALALTGDTIYAGGEFSTVSADLRGSDYASYFSIIPTGAPLAPNAPTAVAGNTTATVTVIPLGSGPAATSYTITSTFDARTCQVTAASPSCEFGGLTNGQPYTFTVTAANSLGISSSSAPSLPVTPTAPTPAPTPVVPVIPPDAPTEVTALPGNTSATVSWTPPQETGTYGIYGYVVRAMPGGQTCSTSMTSCVVEGLTNGTAYAFSVTAWSINSSGPASAPSDQVTPRTVPGAPTSVTAITGEDSARITWTPPADDGGSPVTGYEVTAVPPVTGCATDGAAECTITGLRAGTTYAVTVIAVNSAGESVPSVPVAVTPRAEPTIVLTGSRTGKQERLIVIQGRVKGLDVTVVQPYFRLGKQRGFDASRDPATVVEGDFTWQRMTTRRAIVYVQAGGVLSNRVVIAAR